MMSLTNPPEPLHGEMSLSPSMILLTKVHSKRKSMQQSTAGILHKREPEICWKLRAFGAFDAAGLTEGLIRLRDHYGNPEVYVTENGACFGDLEAADGTVSDADRIDYLRAHLAATQAALTAGVKLSGYFVWSNDGAASAIPIARGIGVLF
jgi:beta-glucosidase/6-phospho-beta-glucosidase/beta-galactosidase